MPTGGTTAANTAAGMAAANMLAGGPTQNYSVNTLDDTTMSAPVGSAIASKLENLPVMIAGVLGMLSMF